MLHVNQCTFTRAGYCRSVWARERQRKRVSLVYLSSRGLMPSGEKSDRVTCSRSPRITRPSVLSINNRATSSWPVSFAQGPWQGRDETRFHRVLISQKAQYSFMFLHRERKRISQVLYTLVFFCDFFDLIIHS